MVDEYDQKGNISNLTPTQLALIGIRLLEIASYHEDMSVVAKAINADNTKGYAIQILEELIGAIK
jgi:hypothetical protein